MSYALSVQASVRVGDLELSAEEEFQVKMKKSLILGKKKEKLSLVGWTQISDGS